MKLSAIRNTRTLALPTVAELGQFIFARELLDEPIRIGGNIVDTRSPSSMSRAGEPRKARRALLQPLGRGQRRRALHRVARARRRLDAALYGSSALKFLHAGDAVTLVLDGDRWRVQ